MTSSDQLWILICVILVFFMQAGFGCLETGLVRSKNNINVAVKNFSDFVISCTVFAIFGYGIMFGSSFFGLFGVPDFSVLNDKDHLGLIFIFQMVFCGTCSTIISGAGAERMSYLSYVILTIIIAGIIYPTGGHWIWGTGGWLAELGAHDFAGAIVVHAVGGWCSLAVAILVGPRIGRFTSNLFTTQAQNFPFAMVGTFILWFGWLGFNGGSVLAFNDTAISVVAVTLLGGVGGSAIALLLHFLKMRVRIIYLLSCCIAGLVAVTGLADLITPLMALPVGVAGGLACIYGDKMLYRFKIDDGIGVVGPHLFPGIVSVMLVPFVADGAYIEANGGFVNILIAQSAMVGSTAVWAFGGTFGIYWLLGKFMPLRVTAADEKRGLNLAEHGITSEIISLQATLRKQIASVDQFGALEFQSNSEIGQLMKLYNNLMDKFKKGHDEWRGSLAQQEASNGLLRTRTVDLEKALIVKEARLAELKAQLGSIARTVEMALSRQDDEEKERNDLIGKLVDLSVAPLRQIKEISDASRSNTSVTQAAGKIDEIVRISNRFRQLLVSAKSLVELENMNSLDMPVEFDLGAMMENVAEGVRRKIGDKKVVIRPIDKIPNVIGEKSMLEGLFSRLIYKAALRAKTRVKVDVAMVKGELVATVRDNGNPITNASIDLSTDPIGQMKSNSAIPSEQLDFDMGYVRRVAELHDAGFSYKRLSSGGMEFRISFPRSQLQKNQMKKAS